MSYKKVENKKLNWLMDEIYEKQRRCHNYEHWVRGDYFEIEEKLDEVDDEITQLKNYAKEAMEIISFYGDSSNWDDLTGGQMLDTINSSDVDKLGDSFHICGGKKARDLIGSSLSKSVREMLDE